MPEPRFPGPPRSPEAPSAERKKQLELGVAWKKREITTTALRNRGIELDPKDVEEYEFRKQEHGLKKTEEPWWAEWMLLEGADSNGTTKTEGKGYRWFGDRVVAYPSHPVDDTLRGADAILMFIDPEDERRATPISVDITTDQADYQKKFEKDFARLSPRIPFEPNVYWADTTTDVPQGYFDAPAEGKIKSLNASVYIPTELIGKFRNDRTKASEADLIMSRLGPYVLKQIGSELETEALTLIEKIRFDDIRSGEVEFPKGLSREDLLSLLAEEIAVASKAKAEKLEILAKVLPSIWDAQDDLGGVHPELEKHLPEVIKNIQQHKRRKKAA